MYFQAIDTAITCIKERFNHVGYDVYYRKLEELLLSAVNGEPYCLNLMFLCRFYEGDIDEFQLIWISDLICHLIIFENEHEKFGHRNKLIFHLQINSISKFRNNIVNLSYCVSCILIIRPREGDSTIKVGTDVGAKA